MHLNETKVSRHDNPDLVKIEFVGEEDAVLVSMRGEGVNDLSNEQAIDRARKVMSGVLGQAPEVRSALGQTLGMDQTLAQP
jgi:hypothetical protein